MSENDPNVLGVELVASALGILMDDLVLVGGCTVGLLITDRASAPVRQTIDIDLVAEVASTAAYYALCEKIRGRGFSESVDADHMCRWRRGALILDLMPTNDGVLGHSTNPWYPAVVHSANRLTLPSGVSIRVVAPPYFLATKLEAFYGRGHGDYSHHDIEDVVNVIDGRPEIVDEVASAPAEVRNYLRSEFDDLLADPQFVDQIPCHLRPDTASQARASLIIERMRSLAGL